MVPFESLGTVFYSPSIVTMAVCLAISEIFSVKQWRDPGNQVRGCSRSLKTAPFDRPHATFYLSAIVNIVLSCTLKLVPFESLGAVSYAPSIVTVAASVAICEIFSVKEWANLDILVWSPLRSLKMAPFDRPHATFYWSAIVNIALSRTIFEFF